MAAYFGQNLVLLEKLASGGMGEVFRARQMGTGGFQKVVAVKRILPQFAMRTDFASMFEQEMKLAARLQHPNIVQVFSNGREGGYLYLVMEFVNGRTVAELLIEARKRKLRLPPEVSCFIAAEVAQGLSYAHNLKDDISGEPLHIVHRDVSPQNIMVGYQGEVKIVDFGIAKVAGVVEASRSGDIKGKVPYAAPEYIEHGMLDSRCDVFALGVVLHELLAQRPLFVADSTYRTLRNVVEMAIPSLIEQFPDIKFELEAIVMRALERDPDFRIQTAEEVARSIAVFTNRAYPNFTRSDFAKFITTIFGDEKDPDQASLRDIHGYAKKVPAAFVQAPTEMVPNQEEDAPGIPSILEKLWGKNPALFGLAGVTACLLVLVIWLVIRRISLPVDVTVPERTPADYAGLIGWYHPRSELLGSGGFVREWSDSSWLKNSLTQSDEDREPRVIPRAQGQYGAVKFDGLNDSMSAPEVAKLLKSAHDITIVTVARAARSKVEAPGYIWSFQGLKGVFDVALFGFVPQNSVRLKLVRDPEAVLLRDSAPLEVTDWTVYLVAIDRSSGRVWRNGVLLQTLPAADAVEFSQIESFSVGAAQVGTKPARFFQGDLLELAVYSRKLDDKEIEGLSLALKKKYSVK